MFFSSAICSHASSVRDCVCEGKEGGREGGLATSRIQRERDRKDARARMYSRKHESCLFVGIRNLT
jgi:hypothetical protein